MSGITLAVAIPTYGRNTVLRTLCLHPRTGAQDVFATEQAGTKDTARHVHEPRLRKGSRVAGG